MRELIFLSVLICSCTVVKPGSKKMARMVRGEQTFVATLTNKQLTDGYYKHELEIGTLEESSVFVDSIFHKDSSGNLVFNSTTKLDTLIAKTGYFTGTGIIDTTGQQQRLIQSATSNPTWTTRVLSDSVRSMNKRINDIIKINTGLQKTIDSLQIALDTADFTIRNKVVSIKKKS